ncbi:SMUG2 DNA glycosylase family protein [Ginsengibacter hankyongi]|uniref:SMUG2 DNA glycosylase family protein n=1 Tax=Ginsengibacter hankyongi TaxID=2607284 RepID=A0A5J5IHJ5_9BACT|nr:uracil-DNA glycosylase family protein [Ginsengibacter hankyongi]KAA9039551.1 SMUG2 DNA glycosylase family protein [Ginsengibacter hankyongi]
MTFSKKILSFFKSLHLHADLPPGVEVLNPFKDKTTFNLCDNFYSKYYNDSNSRYLILGINPGRFGGGITGIPFTDPIRLQTICGIENNFQKKQELSSVFVYEMIHAFGGPEFFYNNFYISSISPLGFTKDNKNLNYYDDRKLENSIKDFVIECLKQQLRFGLKTDIVFCFGEGKNLAYLTRLNNEMKFFDKIVALPHPRFIMQYKLKKKDEYIDQYLRELSVVTSNRL